MGGSTDIGSVFAAVRGFFCLSDGGLAANLPPAIFAALDAGETDPAALLRACQGAMLLASPAVRAHVAPPTTRPAEAEAMDVDADGAPSFKVELSTRELQLILHLCQAGLLHHTGDYRVTANRFRRHDKFFEAFALAVGAFVCSSAPFTMGVATTQLNRSLQFEYKKQTIALFVYVLQENLVITGGAGGIGAATAERLAAKGFAVLVVDRDLAAAEAVAQRLGHPSSACAADVSSEDDVKRYVAAAIERYGRREHQVGGVHTGCRGRPIAGDERDILAGGVSLDAGMDGRHPPAAGQGGNRIGDGRIGDRHG
jgi:hypothetical protein